MMYHCFNLGKERLKSVAESLKNVPSRTVTTLRSSTTITPSEENLITGALNGFDEENIGVNLDGDGLEITEEQQSGDIIYFSASGDGDGCQQLMSFEEDLMNYDEDEDDEKMDHRNGSVSGSNKSSYPSLSTVSASATTAAVVVSDGVKDLMGRTLGYIFLKSLGFR